MGASCGVGSTQVNHAQSLLMLDKALRMQQQTGQAAVQMILEATQPPPKSAEPGKGQAVDVTA
jgi:hypothetical protein